MLVPAVPCVSLSKPMMSPRNQTVRLTLLEEAAAKIPIAAVKIPIAAAKMKTMKIHALDVP